MGTKTRALGSFGEERVHRGILQLPQASQQSHVLPQVPQEYGRVTVTRLLWRQGTRGHDLGHLGSSALAKGKPELDSIRIQPGGPASGPGSSGSGRLPQGGAGKGLGDDLV